MDEIAYEFKGNKNGPVILFIHGFLGSRKDWYDIIPYFKDQYHCLLIDLPAHGESKSSLDQRLYSFDHLALSIVKLLDKLKIKKCYLVGYSMGGRLALYLAIYFFERFYRVVLESASPGLDIEEERIEKLERDIAWAENYEKESYDQFLENWYQQPLFNTLRKHKAFPKLMQQRKENKGDDLANVLRMMGSGKQPAVWYHLEHMVLPVLAVVGDLDEKYKAIASEMHLHYHRVQIKTVMHCGHNVHFENSIEYSKLILDYIGNHANLMEKELKK